MRYSSLARRGCSPPPQQGVSAVIDPSTETVLPFAAAARPIPPVRAATLWRWASAGCRARDGQRIKLETIRIGGSTCTSLEALNRFFARLTGNEAPEQPAPRRGKKHAQAQAALDKAGI